MARARWYFKSGDSERGPYSAHQLARMVQTGVIHPETPVRKGNQDADRSSTGESDGWKEAQRIAFLSQLFERGKAQRRDEPWGGEATTRKLVPLAAKAGAAAAGLLNPDEVMQFYISPFEALQMDGAAAVEELDVKVIQRGKQRLLQELDLNDGKVSWLEDYSLDRSRALNLDEELLDEDRRRYHWAIFQSKHLLRFLTHGAVDHFLNSEDDPPHGALTLFEREPAFRSFLAHENYEVAKEIERLRGTARDLHGEVVLMAIDDVTDDKFKLDDRKRSISEEICRLTPGKRIERLRVEYQNVKDDVTGIVRESGNDLERRQLHELVTRENVFLNTTNPQKLETAIDELRGIALQILRRKPDFLLGVFQHLIERREVFNDQPQAKNLIEAGKRHIAVEDYDHLDEVIGRLYSLLPQEEQRTGALRYYTGIR